MRETFEIIIPTLFGLEAFAAREVRKLGYETSSVEDGRVTFTGDWEAVCLANLWIRTGERVLVKVAEFQAETFEELFQGTLSSDWSRWIPSDGAFPVKGHCLKSQLASVRDCQAIIKKAAAKSLSNDYGIEWLEETGAVYQIQFSILKNRVTLMIDTTGDALHKRGYRAVSNAAPLRETIAAAMVMMSHWKYEYPLADPFCGSGTIPIEAAMIKRNIAPGLKRGFASERFCQIPPEMWSSSRKEALEMEKDIELIIHASDIDPKCVALTAENAAKAGLDKWIKPVCADARDFTSEIPGGTIITNPPYGERMSDAKSCRFLYQALGKAFARLPDWSYYILTAYTDFEKAFGKNASKRRKIYNGMLRCDLYQYFAGGGKRIDKNFKKG